MGLLLHKKIEIQAEIRWAEKVRPSWPGRTISQEPNELKYSAWSQPKVLITYRKVASSRLSWLLAHIHSFRLFMKGKFDA